MKKLATVIFAVVAFTAALADYTKSYVVGTWLLNGTDKNTRWVFKGDDSFVFKGTMSSSKGKWSTDGKLVFLSWTEVDGQPVKANTIKGKYPLNEDGSFQVDNYVYRKQK